MKITVTTENIEQIKDGMACDQAKELEVGCQTWRITYSGGCSGTMTVWPNGRGAVELGGDSIWGDWQGELLYTEDYDANGNTVVYDADGEQHAMTSDGLLVDTAI